MATTFTFTSVADTWPSGTSVGAYPRANQPTGFDRASAPTGAATSTGTVAADGSLAFAGLTDDTRYLAGAQVSGTWKFKGFRTDVAASSASSSSTGSFPAYLGPVSNRCRIPVGTVIGSGTYKQVMTWRAYRAADKIPAAKLLYTTIAGVTENTATASGTVEASIEYPAGTITRITFAGSNQGTIPVNDHVISDMVTLPTAIPAGARFWVGTFVDWATSTNVPRFQDGIYTTGNAQATFMRESHIASTTTVTNTVMTGVRGTNGGLSGKTGDSYGPSAILGMTQRPTVFIAGDSESQQQFPPISNPQQLDFEGVAGIIEQIIGYRLGFINGAIASDTYALANATYTKRLALSQYCTHIIDAYGINGVYTQNLATNQADLTTFRAKFPTTKPYFKTTLIPKVTGAWIKADLSDQTPVATLANMVAFNDWVRQACGGLVDGVIDLEAVCSPAPGTGLIYPAQRVVSDAAITAAASTLTSATAAFTAADVGKWVQIMGAGAAGAPLAAVIQTVTNATTVTITSYDTTALTASTTVSGVSCGIGLHSWDGLHQTRIREYAIRDSGSAQRAVAPILALG